MKNKIIKGFMLGGDNCVLMPGDQWWPCDSDVWICKTQSMAKEILLSSRHGIKNNFAPVWIIVYKVKAKDIDGVWDENGLFHTSQPAKIMVQEIVGYFPLERFIGQGIVASPRHMINSGFVSGKIR